MGAIIKHSEVVKQYNLKIEDEEDNSHKCNCTPLWPLYASPGLNNVSPRLTGVDYHIMMDKFLEPLMQYFWSNGQNDPLEYIKVNFPNLEKQSLTGIEISCILQALCMLCYQQGDRILKLSKRLLKVLENHKNLADNYFFRIIATHLQFYPYMGKNKVGKAQTSLEEGKLVLGNAEASEWTGWYCRAQASYHLQCAWLFQKGRSDYKKNARENFIRSRDHFNFVRSKNASCQYLQFLPILSLVNILFLTLQFCWYMFDESSIKAKFASCDIEMLDLEKADGLVRQIETEANSLTSGTIWQHDIQYHILESKFFLEYRKAQRHKHQRNIVDAVRCIHTAEDLLSSMFTKYNTPNKEKLLDSFKSVVCDFFDNLPAEFVVTEQRTDDVPRASEGDSSEDQTMAVFSTQSSALDTDYNSDLCH